MAIEEAVIDRIKGLIVEAPPLSRHEPVSIEEVTHGRASSREYIQRCRGWIAAARHIVQMAVVNPDNSYRKMTEDLATNGSVIEIGQTIGEIAAILSRLLEDIQAGLLSSVADRARAEVFDNFLDSVKFYLNQKHLNFAGVMAGVVFEDSIRRICRKHKIEERDIKLDQLISELVKAEILSEVKAKRARVAANVRNKATHAQWDEFDKDDVMAAVQITEELIREHIDG